MLASLAVAAEGATPAARLIAASLRLQAWPYAALDEFGLRLALGIVFLAGLSAALGQSLVLFANRVRPHRFVASLLLSALIYVGGFFLWSGSIWLLADLGFDREAEIAAVTRAIALAYSPFLLSFFVLVPYLGSFIAVALSVWSLLAMVLATRTLFDLPLWPAVVCSAGGWVLLQVAGRTVGRPLLWLNRGLRRWVAGTRLERNLEALAGRREDR